MSLIGYMDGRAYSYGDPIYVTRGGKEETVWHTGNPKHTEDLCEIICRVVEQSGVELSEEDVDNIRVRLGRHPMHREYLSCPECDYFPSKGMDMERCPECGAELEMSE